MFLLIFGLSFFLRAYGAFSNYPFWVDEFSTANQAKYILKYGINVFNNPDIYFETHNITTHSLVALFFKIFGQHEWVARLPFVIVGSFVPLLVFYLAEKMFNKTTAVSASLLTTFSYFMIVWSRQARGYVLLQLLVLLTIFFYLKLLENRGSIVIATSIIISSLLGILTHSMFYILFIALVADFIFYHREILQVWLKSPWSYLLIVSLLVIIYKIGFLSNLIGTYYLGVLKANNLWYYHSFLWREYGLITFLSIVGIILGMIKKKYLVTPIVFYIVFQLIFISFLFHPYVLRYLLPIFPFLFIFAGYAITHISNLILQRYQLNKYKFLSETIPILIVLFIIINGYKFVNKPKRFYSVNHDFREIALIDYHQVYNIIKQKGDLKKGETAVIDTWWDRLYWYLGQDYKPAYAFRWQSDPGLINGLPRFTPLIINSAGEKIIPQSNNVQLISNLSDFKKAMNSYSKGFIFIDDSSLPHDVIAFVEKNLKKEIYLDHYPLDDNPYSIWPATLYSWGIN